MRHGLTALGLWLAIGALPGVASAQEAARVRVRVVDDLRGEAVSGARVSFSDLDLDDETDRSGVASFDAVPVGERTIQVTREGFASASQTLAVTVGALVEASITLRLQPLGIEGIYVNADRQWSTTLVASGFAERAKLGFGKQLDRAAVRRGNQFRLDRAIEYLIPRRCAQEFRPSPLQGAMGVGDPNYRAPPPGGSRGGTTPSTQPIPTQTMGMGVPPIVFLDGVRYTYEELKDIPIDWVEGVEVYSSFAGLPAKYSGLAPCGAILIWTG